LVVGCDGGLGCCRFDNNNFVQVSQT
jgi:hypothetical protein